jgi:methanogenic corrinoid protein MtbC1
MGGMPIATTFNLCGEEAAIERIRKRKQIPARLNSEAISARAQQLADVLEGDIIPRLTFAHYQDQSQDNSSIFASTSNKKPEIQAVEDFALLAVSATQDSLMAVVGGLLQQGVSMEAIYLDFLSPAAQRLGDYWLSDQLSFAEVTIALGKLQVIVHELSMYGPRAEGVAGSGRSALFAPVPGEQHTFGLSIVAEFFRRSGWRTWTETTGRQDEVERAAAATHFDLIGFSVACEEHLAQLRPVVMSIRRVSRNPDICVLVGGSLVAARPGIAKEVGADLSAADARQAMLVAEGAIRERAR